MRHSDFITTLKTGSFRLIELKSQFEKKSAEERQKLLLKELSNPDSALGAIIIPLMIPVSKRVQISWIKLLFEILTMFTLSYPKYFEHPEQKVPLVRVVLQNF